MSAKWSLDPNDIACSGMFGSSSSSTRGQFNRELKTTSCELTLRHIPTSLEVQGEIPPGHYSKKTMRALREELFRKLFTALEEKVARHLRVPGR